MPPKQNSLFFVAALLLPILALSALVVRAEFIVQTGTEWTVRIEGYDPRDLISGQYLQYRIRWNLEGTDCHGDGCCYCLWNSDLRQKAPPEPSVRIVSCDNRAPCESAFPVSREAGLHRFYIPEGEGRRLERAIREQEATLRLRVTTRGSVAITDLLLNRTPYRKALSR